MAYYGGDRMIGDGALACLFLFEGNFLPCSINNHRASVNIIYMERALGPCV